MKQEPFYINIYLIPSFNPINFFPELNSYFIRKRANYYRYIYLDRHRYRYDYNSRHTRKYNFILLNQIYHNLKELIFYYNYKNKEIIKSLNSSYYNTCEFIIFMFSKIKQYLGELNAIESSIFIFYIIIFVLKRILY